MSRLAGNGAISGSAEDPTCLSLSEGEGQAGSPHMLLLFPSAILFSSDLCYILPKEIHLRDYADLLHFISKICGNLC